MRFRLALYVLLFAVFSGGLAWTLSNRSPIDFNMSRAHAHPFNIRNDGVTKIIINQIQLHIKNQTDAVIKFTLSLSDKNIADGYKLSTPAIGLELQPEQDIKIPAFIELDEKLYSSKSNKIDLILKTDKTTLLRTIQFIRIQ